MSSGGYNMRNPAVKRLCMEAAELRTPTEMFYAQPIEDNLFEWHFTVRGPPDTAFAGGIYHGRITLPPEYPMKPPSIMMLTANGRFELNKKICLSISGYHPESWQPSWSIRTALLAIIGFMPTPGAGAIGALDYTPEERKKLALKSLDHRCNVCGVAMKEVLPEMTNDSQALNEESQTYAKQLIMKGQGTVETAVSAEQPMDGSGEVTPVVSVTPPVPPTPPTTPVPPVDRPRVFNVNPAAFTVNTTPATPNSSLASTLLITVVSLLILVLIARRVYITNEWRFSHSDEL